VLEQAGRQANVQRESQAERVSEIGREGRRRDERGGSSSSSSVLSFVHQGIKQREGNVLRGKVDKRGNQAGGGGGWTDTL